MINHLIASYYGVTMITTLYWMQALNGGKK